MSRTRPMNAATAPMRASPLRNAAISRATSKSPVWTRTLIWATLAPGHRREQRDLIAGLDRRVGFRDVEVHRDAHRPTGRQLGGPRATTRAEPCEQRRHGAAIV